MALGFPGGSDGKDSLEEEMVTHSSLLAWRLPRTEEPGRPQSGGRTESDVIAYNVALVSAAQHPEAAIGTHMSPPS